jgi:hypothetical protein
MCRIHYAPGWYWVRQTEDSELEIARLTDEGEWLFAGTDARVSRQDSEGWGFYWIGEWLEPPRNAR